MTWTEKKELARDFVALSAPLAILLFAVEYLAFHAADWAIKIHFLVKMGVL